MTPSVQRLPVPAREHQVGVTWPNPRFEADSTGDCMTDNLTAVIWIRSPTSGGTWQQALNFANNLDACGFTDWRLPSRKELRSLIDYGDNSLAWLLSQGFKNLYAGDHWSSTTVAGDATQAWSLILINGVVLTESKTTYNHIWAVRAGR